MRWATQWTCEVDLEDPPLFAGGWKLGGMGVYGWDRKGFFVIENKFLKTFNE